MFYTCNAMKLKKDHLYCLAVFALLALIALVLDALCLELVGEEEKTLIKNVVSLRHVKNTGAAFSLLRNCPWVASILGALILATITAFMLFGKMRLAARLSLSAALSGGACNLYMRVFRGGVNDWIELGFMRFPLFNFADICVCVGAALFVVFYVFSKGNDADAA